MWVVATRRWRFPMLPNTDPRAWCSRCNSRIREDITHCLWSCPSSFLCWQWCAWLLKEISDHRNGTLDWQVVLTPAHVFIALSFPVARRILEYFGTSFTLSSAGKFGRLGMIMFLPIEGPTTIERLARRGTVWTSTHKKNDITLFVSFNVGRPL